MSAFLVILVVLSAAYYVTSLAMEKMGAQMKLPSRLAVLIVGGVALLVALFFLSVGGQEVAVLISPGGVVQEPLKTGWHFVPPWYSVQRMDKTVWVYTFSSRGDEGAKSHADAIWAPTRDGIKMGLDLSISWAIDPEYAPWIYANVSEQDGSHDARYRWIEEQIIRAKAKSATALTVSEYTPIEVYSSKRSDIQVEIAERLKKDFAAYHLLLHQVDLREVFYNTEYEQAINAKKLAEQEVLRLVEVTKQKTEQLKQSELDKNMKIKLAEGESQALKIKGQSITTNPKIIQLEWINKWDGVLPNFVVNGGGSGKSDMLPFMMNFDSVPQREHPNRASVTQNK